jgi:hypothetical protein
VTVTRRLLVAAPLGAVLVGAVLLLSACDPRETGSAAVVGGSRITESQLDGNAAAVSDLLHRTGADVPATDLLLQAQLQTLIDDKLVTEAARREGITVTQGQVDDLIDKAGGRDQLSQQLLTQQNLWLLPQDLDALAYSYLVQQNLGQRLAPGQSSTAQGQAVGEYMSNLSKEVGVSVSPRYGAWDPSALRIGAAPDDLSQPAGGSPSASPSPSASTGTG